MYKFSRGCPEILPRYKKSFISMKWRIAPEIQHYFIVCQRWRYSEKIKTGITFDLYVVLTYVCFLKVTFFESVSVEKYNCMLFSEVQ